LNGVVSQSASFQMTPATTTSNSGPGVVIMPLPPQLTPPGYSPFVGLITVSDPVVAPSDPVSTTANSPVLQNAGGSTTQAPRFWGDTSGGGGGTIFPPSAGIIVGFTPDIPEPSSLTLVVLGALAFASQYKRLKRQRAH
jgi:hypothetical protein